MPQIVNKARICGAPGSRARAGGAVNHCSIQALPASLTHGAPALLCRWGDILESCSSCPGGHSPGWKLHWPPCLLWSCAGPGAQAGREGAGQGRTRRSGRQRKWCFLQSAVGLQQPMVGQLSPSPTWPGDKDGMISLHVSCQSWMFPCFISSWISSFPAPSWALGKYPSL